MAQELLGTSPSDTIKPAARDKLLPTKVLYRHPSAAFGKVVAVVVAAAIPLQIALALEGMVADLLGAKMPMLLGLPCLLLEFYA